MADVSVAAQQLEWPTAGAWEIDPVHSHLGFVARHVTVAKVRGRFTEFSGRVHIDEVPARSSVEVTIEAGSITTDSAERDAHLRSPDFLDVERYTVLTFRSTGVEVTGEDTVRISGALTVKDVTRPVTLDVTYEGVQVDPWGKTRAGFSAVTEIDRQDFGVAWNLTQKGGLLVGRKIRMDLDVELVQTAVPLSEPSSEAS